MPKDMLLFSVRRGSAVIGMLDSIFMAPISEGDILTTPVPAGGPPGIFIAAEALGLATERGGANRNDDLNAMDVHLRAIRDCDGNGLPDWLDLAKGNNVDTNNNSIPDKCEEDGDGFCYCSAAVAPCNNADPAAGCRNSSGAGAVLNGSGSSSIFSDDLVLTTTSMPANQFGIFFMGAQETAAPLPFHDGARCVGGTLFRFQQQVFHSGSSGSTTFGPGIVNFSCTTLGAAGCINAVGQTWHFQTWFRDPQSGPCGNGSNASNAWRVTFTM
jgi:hypothetical protein